MRRRRLCRRRSLLQKLAPCGVESAEPDPHPLHRVIRLLPAADLRTTLARGVLIDGHCYGPLNPIQNILINSIWYATAFPLGTDNRIDVAIISTDSLSRVVQRSLDGLVASLRHRCPALSHDDALRHLQSARATSAPLSRPHAALAEATVFRAATEAARHSKPVALAHFLATVERDAVSAIAGNTVLSSADIAPLSALLAPSPLPDERPQPPLRERRPKIIRNSESSMTGVITSRGATRACLRWQMPRCTNTPTKLGNNMNFTPSIAKPSLRIIRSFMCSCQALQAHQPVCFFAEVLRPPLPGYH
uniref:PIR2-like helical domain-containing protein n=1 Tax=Oryza punctata TaxID=4537 RepID=A0A0E0JHQ5_ORYPU